VHDTLVTSPNFVRSLVRGPLARSVVLGAAFLLGSCTQLNALLASSAALKAPSVTLKQVSLAETPSQKRFAAYFCPRVLKERMNLGMAADLICSRSFGPPAPTEQMKVSFDVQLSVQNPNQIPIPLASALTSVDVFPGAQESQLGAVCVSLCAPDDPQCSGQDARACPANATDVTQRNQVVQAIGKMLIAEGARLATGQPLGLEAPKVAASSALDVVVRVGFDPQQLLPVLQQLAGNAASQLQQGQPIKLSIPYSLAGTMFTGSMGTAGVLSAPFGPVNGSFDPS
jgi:hypothetical protein